jgi:acid stress-induced BolA-like protein IbaG/YrbA
MTTPEMISGWLQQAFPEAKINVEGDGRHFEAHIVANDFAGKNTLARHRMVYEALGDKMDQAIHALSIKALTPDEQAN